MGEKAKLVNGKYYPLWQQFVDKKDEWNGGTLSEVAGDIAVVGGTTEIVDVILTPNGKESAWFEIVGRDFSCGFDVHYGGISGDRQTAGWLTFHGYG